MSRDIAEEFILDTVMIKKHMDDYDRTTYSFKIYPLNEILDENEYYNLVYEKVDNQWYELLFKITEKLNSGISETKIEESKLVYTSQPGVEINSICTYTRSVVECYQNSCSAAGLPQCDGYNCTQPAETRCYHDETFIYFCSDIEINYLILDPGPSIGGGGSVSEYEPNPVDENCDGSLQCSSYHNFVLYKQSLNSEYLAFLESHPEINSSIFTYLSQNLFSQTSKLFSNQMIAQMILNPGVFTSIKSFLIEKQINDTQLDPCPKGVFQQIKNTTNNDFAKVLAKLGADGSVYNTTMISAVAPSQQPAQTVRTSAYNYKIYISTDYEDKTKLFIASLQLHELVHAYFLSLIDDCLIQNNCQLLATFPELWEYYVSVCDNQYPSNSSSHHEQIANSYVTAISAALQEYQPGLPQQVYDDLAWSGLEETTVFNTIHPIGSVSRQRILNRKAAEQSGHPIDEGTPQEQINYGQPCN